ncbi:MAG: 2,3-bisphosphoglycerate-independent phosphoglycerate mutase [Nanoarchaeota archaeon]|nr:2,3-bisphosphoglycerate-independent phosphoglycerate mutase [Nanoarchaeota archaeon]
MQLLLVILDGLGDLPIKNFGGKTPLEAARTPFMDSFADKGETGLMFSMGRGVTPTSGQAFTNMMGYDVKTSRGAAETLGIGVLLKDNEVGFRTDFGHCQKGIVKDRRAGRINEVEAEKLGKELNQKIGVVNGVEVVFKQTLAHRGILILHSDKKLSANVSNTDPHMPGRKLKTCKSLDKSREAGFTARTVNLVSRKASKILEKSVVNAERKKKGLMTANCLLLRGAGSKLPDVKSLPIKYKKFWAAIVREPVERGIAHYLGMNVVDVSSPERDVKSDLIEKLRGLKHNMDEYDCVVVHIKGPDEPGHDGDPERKKKAIELVDKVFFKNVAEWFDPKETLLCVTSDHSTPCSKKAHSADPVPLLLYGKGAKKDGVKAFSEKQARKGSVGVINGLDLMPLLMKRI